MKKYLLIVACTLFMCGAVVSCGSKEANKEQPTNATEAVVDEETPETRAALAEAEALLNEIKAVVKKAEAKELSHKEALEALFQLAAKDAEWDKKYKSLKEADYTPTQWKHLQEMKEEVKNLLK